MTKKHPTIVKILGFTGNVKYHVTDCNPPQTKIQQEMMVELSDGTEIIMWSTEEGFKKILQNIEENRQEQ